MKWFLRYTCHDSTKEKDTLDRGNGKENPGVQESELGAQKVLVTPSPAQSV